MLVIENNHVKKLVFNRNFFILKAKIKHTLNNILYQNNNNNDNDNNAKTILNFLFYRHQLRLKQKKR